MDAIDNFFNDNIDVPQKSIDEYIVGIDLGTCTSCVGIWRNNTFEVIPDEHGNRTIPSVVAFTNRSTYIGYEAKNQIHINPHNTIYEIKRLMGKKISDQTVLSDSQFIAYNLCADDNDNVNIMCMRDGKQVIITPEMISSFILMKLKAMASDYLKTDIKKAVITVPAYFNDAQRQATKDAATIAGLECVRILNEPIASALAYGLMKLSKSNDTNVIVYDLGGGTLDIALLTITDGIFEVINTAGNTHLGGVDFDNRLVSFCIAMFKLKHSDFQEDILSAETKQRLYKSCENAKKVLSTSLQTTIGVVGFYNNIDLVINLTRDKFNELCHDLLIFCLKPLDDILTTSNMKKDSINEIILVGGMTRVIAIRENIQKFFNKIPNSSINPDEIVANGAAIQAYMLSNGTEDAFSESITLLDMTPLSLGVETLGGVMNILIPRNSPIPTSEKQMFSNDTSGETSVVIKVFEGERRMTKDNFFVGEFELHGLAPAPIGFHKIEVSFTIDINGMITVTAEDLRYSHKTSLCVTGHCGRLTPDAIQKMLLEAQEYEQYDKICKKKKKLHYELTEMCDNISKNLEFRENNIDNDERQKILFDIEIIREVLKMDYDNIEISDYENEIKRLGMTYTILTLKIGNTQYNFTGIVNDNNGTSVYQNEEDDNDKIHAKLVANELGYVEDDSNHINELKRVRDSLVEMCNNTLEILNSPCTLLNTETANDLKDFVEDLLVWIHVQEKITIIECNEKMDELTKMCNECVSTIHIDSDNIDAKSELYLLCTTLHNSITSDSFGINEDMTEELEKMITDIEQWCKEDHNTDEYRKKIDLLNSVCNKMYDIMIEKK